MLVVVGDLVLVDPVAKWCPEFAEILVDRWAALAAKSGRSLTEYHYFSAAMCGPFRAIIRPTKQR